MKNYIHKILSFLIIFSFVTGNVNAGNSGYLQSAGGGTGGGTGGGDISGPGASTDNALVRWDGTAGTDIQNSSVILSDTNNMTGINDLDVDGRMAAGNSSAIGTFGGLSRVFDFSHTITDFTASSDWEVFRRNITLDSAAHYTGNIYVDMARTTIPEANTRNQSFINTFGIIFEHHGSGTVGSVFAGGAIADNMGVGRLNNSDGFDIYSFNSGSGSIGRNTGLYLITGAFDGSITSDDTIFIDSPANAGMVGTHTAINILDQAVSGNSWSIYNQALQPNWFRGKLGIGEDSTPTDYLEIQSPSGAGDASISLGDLAVAHGMTSIDPTTNFFRISMQSSAEGGAVLTGLSDADQLPMVIKGYFGATDPTDTFGAISLVGGRRSATTVAAMADGETLFNIWNGSISGNPVFKVLGNGDTDIAGRLAAGNAGVIGAGLDGVQNIVDFSNNIPDIGESTDWAGLNVVLTADTSTENFSAVRTGRFKLTVPITSTDNIGSLFGIENELVHSGEGTITNFYGFRSRSYNTNIGTIENNYGATFQSGAIGGSITNDATLTILTPQATGTLHAHTGLMIQNQAIDTDDGGGAGYAIKSEGGRNWFSGNVGIGNTALTPTAPLFIINDTSGAATIRLAESGIAHSMTSISPAAVYSDVGNLSAGAGGVRDIALRDNDGVAHQWEGYISATSPLQETFKFIAGRWAGGVSTSATTIAGSIPVMTINNYTTSQLFNLTSAGRLAIGDVVSSPSDKFEIVAASGSSNPAVLAMRDVDVVHGMTAVSSNTDVFFQIKPDSETAGGAVITGLSDIDGTSGLTIKGIIGATDPADTLAAVNIVGSKKNTTGSQAIGNFETVFAVWNNAISGSPSLGIAGNGNVGINVSPSISSAQTAKLMLVSGGNTSSTSAIKIRNSDLNSLLYVQDNRRAGINTETLNSTLEILGIGSTSGVLGTIHAVGGTSTGLTASTEVPQFDLDFGQTRTWAAGAITTQRTGVIRRETLAFASASTVTNAATFAITDAPAAGANATITNPYAFWVQSGASRFDGNITTNGTLTSSNTGAIGWSAVAAANQACNTTCTSACVGGLDQGTLGAVLPSFVSCTDATADQCFCAGSN